MTVMTTPSGGAALIAGVDEAGRGPLAGPVFAAAVILSPDRPIVGLRDSKKLTARQRERLAAEIRDKALCLAITTASVEDIDRLNILHATLDAMRRAVEALAVQPARVLVDGNQRPPIAHLPVETLIGGDDIEPAIAAASILAKTARDALMLDYAQRYPGYGFEKHKGYGTRLHLDALRELGPTEVHRRSFAPVARLLPAAAKPPVPVPPREQPGAQSLAQQRPKPVAKPAARQLKQKAERQLEKPVPQQASLGLDDPSLPSEQAGLGLDKPQPSMKQASLSLARQSSLSAQTSLGFDEPPLPPAQLGTSFDECSPAPPAGDSDR